METVKGYVQSRPEMVFTQNGIALVRLYLADKQGSENDRQYRIVCWEALAEVAEEILQVDDFIYIKGYWKQKAWQGRDKQSYTTTELKARQIWKIDEHNQPINILRLTNLPIKEVYDIDPAEQR
jgi:single-stranded DNA-binding protein